MWILSHLAMYSAENQDSFTIHYHRVMSPTLNDIHVLIFTTYKYATLPDKRDFTDGITNLQRRRLCR